MVCILNLFTRCVIVPTRTIQGRCVLGRARATANLYSTTLIKNTDESVLLRHSTEKGVSSSFRLFSGSDLGVVSAFQRFSTRMPGKKVCVVGSGNWGSCIARIIGQNVVKFPTFDNTVNMYVYEEMVDGRKLTEIINTDHENVKYLKGIRLPDNVVAVPDIVDAAQDADILVFVIPHQFLARSLAPLQGKMKSGAIGLSLIKGFDLKPDSSIKLITEIVTDVLPDIHMSVLMGANLAGEVAAEKFCETTIGCKDPEMGKMLKDMIQTDNFRVVVVDDVSTVEVCGALKNIVACAAGFVDGMDLGDNTKAAVIRLGLMEMIKFAEVFYPGARLSTFFESCGVADLVTTCYGGRNRKVSEAFVRTGKSIEELEKEMLNGQRLQGPQTAAEVNGMLKMKDMENKFPLFTAVHRICTGVKPASMLIDCIRIHPEHMCADIDKIRCGSFEKESEL